MIIFGLLLLLSRNDWSQALPLYHRAGPLLSPDETPSTRTILNIVWSCLLTVVICAWTSVHPNVPPQHQGRAFWRRIGVLFWTVIAPELILAWAVRQWFAAREIRDIYNRYRGSRGSKRWSIWHGHFLAMGGITLVSAEIYNKEEPEEPGVMSSPEERASYPSRLKDYEDFCKRCELGPLTFERFKVLVQNPKFEFPVLTSAGIKDRSKRDALAKGIAIIQSTWFILQCVARAHQKLALTELELVTLALASLNAITFAFWWYKPLGVQEPVILYLRTEPPRLLEIKRQRQGIDVSMSYVVDKVSDYLREAATNILEFLRNPCTDDPCDALVRFFITLPFILLISLSLCLLLPFPLAIVTMLKIVETDPVVTDHLSSGRGLIAIRIVIGLRKVRYWLTFSISRFFGTWLKKIFDDKDSTLSFFVGWFFLLPTLFFLLFSLLLFLFPFFALLFLISFIFTSIFGIIATSDIQSGATHVPSFYAPTTASDRYSRMLVFAFFGVVFGGLHCIGWYFTYPTDLERMLWRVTSLIITVIPIIVAPIDFLVSNRDLSTWGRAGRTTLWALDLIMTVLLFIYVPARLSLIAQALALLRDQPSSAFIAVDWTRYIPHL